MKKLKITTLETPKNFNYLLPSLDFAVGDIESPLNDNNEFVFQLGVILYKNHFYRFTCVHDMFDFIKNKKIKKIYFHNLDFDFLFFLKNCELGQDIEIINSGNMTLVVKFRGFSFVNSLSILPMSLKNVVRKFLGLTWESWENQKSDVFGMGEVELFEYCTRDVWLLAVALHKLFEIIRVEYDIKNFLTIPSLSLKVLLHSYVPKGIFDGVKYKKFFNKDYYFGGHTEKFISGKYNFKGLNYYDVNSLYPYIMSILEFGISEPIFIEPKMSSVLDFLDSGTMFFGEFRINVDCEELRFFVSRDNDRNNYNYGSGWYKLSEISIGFLIENGYRDNILDCRTLIKYDEKLNIFKAFVIDMFKKRKSDIAYDVIFKLILNGGYGKFGQKDTVGLVKLNPNSVGSYDWDTVTNYQNNILCRGVKDVAINQQKYLRKDIAGKITEGARVYMTKLRNLSNNVGCDVIYQDTDSLIVKGKLEDYKEFDEFLCNKTLGKLKRENDKDLDGIIVGQKIYYMFNKNESFNASKGVKNMNKSDYIGLARFLSLRQSKFVVNGDKGFCLNYINPKNDFYNTRFTKMKTLIKSNFFGITIVPHFINEVRERLD